MFMTNIMLLWWKLDSVPLPLVIKPKEVMQWRSKQRAQVQSYVNQTEVTNRIELTMQLHHTSWTALSFEEKLT